VEHITLDKETCEKNTESLVSWIKIHHPELDGFVNNQTLDGAQDYLKAIELYSKRGLLKSN